MAAFAVFEPIPDEMAVKLCDEVRDDNSGKWYTFRGLWCWGCRKFSKGDAGKRRYASKDGNRGCPEIGHGIAQRGEKTDDVIEEGKLFIGG